MVTLIRSPLLWLVATDPLRGRAPVRTACVAVMRHRGRSWVVVGRSSREGCDIPPSLFLLLTTDPLRGRAPARPVCVAVMRHRENQAERTTDY